MKKTTIHPEESLVGYMNIKQKSGKILTINIMIEDKVYTFNWDVSEPEEE